MSEPEGFLEFQQAAQAVGASPTVLRRRLQRAGLPLFVHPGDHRRRLLRTTDFEVLVTPRPARPRKEAAVPA